MSRDGFHSMAIKSGNDMVNAVLESTRFVLNSGPVTIEPVPNFIRLPAGHAEYVIDYHGLARDRKGRIYVLYNSLKRFPYTRALARFYYAYDDGVGRCVFDTFLGTRDWAEGTVHGLHIGQRRRSDGILEECLSIVNNDGTMILADLEGHEIWRKDLIAAGITAPTAAAISANGDAIGVVDGYGTNKNFFVRTVDGELVGQSGEKGSKEGQAITNHGIDLDPDGNFVVADRGNRRFTWWNSLSLEPIYDNGIQRKLELAGLEVCCIAFHGQFAIAPCLNSTLAFLAVDRSSPSGLRLIGAIEIPEELRTAGLDGIHDAEFTEDGRYVIVGVWERHRAVRQIPTLIAFRTYFN